MSIGATRTLFLDSRYKVSGTDADFTIVLAQDVNCTRTSSFYVASCSFANTFSTVTPYNRGAYQLFSYPFAVGQFTPADFGAQIQAAIAATGLFQSMTVANDGDANVFRIVLTDSVSPPSLLFIPNYAEIDKFFYSLNPTANFPVSAVRPRHAPAEHQRAAAHACQVPNRDMAC